MKEKFIEKRFTAKTLQLLGKIKAITVDYASQGYKLSLRQLYYQLVAANLIPNEERQYKKISSVLTDARMCGAVDWDIIEDRVRVPQMHAEWDSASDLMRSAVIAFRLPRHKDQEHYIELHVEKDALTSILQPITDHYHIALVVNRGYSSTSAMYRASKRFQREYRYKDVIVLYLGDHDPSGMDMDRDIRDRQGIFRADIKVIRIGLTMEQIEEYNPPPNPAKLSDPRAKWYVEKYGNISWEVDALRPQVLDELVRGRIEDLIDMDLYNDVLEEEENIKFRLNKKAEEIDEETNET